jgi:putative transposase
MHRRSIRLRGHDYSRGVFFITVCASTHLFGRVEGDVVSLSRWGEIARECWTSIPMHFPHVRLDSFVVMPDHIHGILLLGDRQIRIAAIGRMSAGSLGAVVRSFKAAVANRVSELRGQQNWCMWQRNYFDRIIPNPYDLARARRYIRDNPARWDRNRDKKRVGAQHAAPLHHQFNPPMAFPTLRPA